MTTATETASAHDGRLAGEVREVMTPGVVSIPAVASIRQAYAALAAHRVHAVLVVDRKSNAPLGWVTAGGLLHWALKDSHQHSAGQAICEPIHTISPSASIREAAEMLVKPGISHLLVGHQDGCAPEGVVSDVDVVRALSRR
jgi:CBS domain-containing protein